MRQGLELRDPDLRGGQVCIDLHEHRKDDVTVSVHADDFPRAVGEQRDDSAIECAQAACNADCIDTVHRQCASIGLDETEAGDAAVGAHRDVVVRAGRRADHSVRISQHARGQVGRIHIVVVVVFGSGKRSSTVLQTSRLIQSYRIVNRDYESHGDTPDETNGGLNHRIAIGCAQYTRWCTSSIGVKPKHPTAHAPRLSIHPMV